MPPPPDSSNKTSLRRPTVYDAVAKRLSTIGFTRYGYPPIPPDEALFRTPAAPERDVEHDIYWANRELGNSQVQDALLPDSDLLKAVHAFASDYYGSTLPEDEAEIAFRSMDGTALLTLGILIEEECRRLVDGGGYKTFLDVVEDKHKDDGDSEEDTSEPNRNCNQGEPLEGQAAEEGVRQTAEDREPGQDESESLPRRKQKRRKLEDPENA